GRAGRRTGQPGIAITYCSRSPHDLYHFRNPERIIMGRTRPPAIRLENGRLAERHVAALCLSEYFRSRPDRTSRFGTVRSFLGDLEEQSVLADFRLFITDVADRLTGKLSGIAPKELLAASKDGQPTWIDKIAGEESRLARAIDEVQSDYRATRNLQNQWAKAEKYSDA
ncbi:DEAD/DEAH box helicase domain-containing protein, partial [mine drainage metagenome]